jgi:hypothetical protein
MFKVNRHSNSKGKSVRLTLLHLISFELGLHDVNGMHISAGFGIGPVEVSTSLHHWDKW